jgi:hypothetical protein
MYCYDLLTALYPLSICLFMASADNFIDETNSSTFPKTRDFLKTSKVKQGQARPSQLKQARASSSKHKQAQASSSKLKRAQASSRKLKQTHTILQALSQEHNSMNRNRQQSIP